MMQALRDYYRGQMFRPGLAGLLVNPFYFARKGLYDAIQELSAGVAGKLLDVGCGSRPYERLFAATEYVGLELDTPENRARGLADVYYDGAALPFATASFDAIVCNQVLEHVFEPDRFLGEMRRVLRPGGRMLLSVPFAWDEHEQPRDFARYSSFGLAALLRKSGFEILEHRKTMPDARAVFQLVNAYLFKVTATGNKYVDLGVALLLMAPVNIAGTALSRVTPANPDLYLDNVVLAARADGK